MLWALVVEGLCIPRKKIKGDRTEKWAGCFQNSEQEEEIIKNSWVMLFFPLRHCNNLHSISRGTDFNYLLHLNGFSEKVGKKIFHSHFRKMQRSLP